MLVVKTPDKYQCEICNSLYLTKEEALECEAIKLPECKFKVGDRVLAPSRYDGYFELEVSEIVISKPSIVIKPFHQYLVITSKSLEVCKDGTNSNIWYCDELIAIKDLKWVKNINICKTSEILAKKGNSIYRFHNSYIKELASFVDFAEIQENNEHTTS